MGRIATFTHVTVDGFFAGPRGEIDWFKSIAKDPEYDAFTHDSASGGSALMFGRTTYEMMKSYWPTAEAIRADPRMARVVDESPKIVFSRALASTPEGPNWKHITLLREIDPKAIARRKASSAGDFTILGSGSIVQQLGRLGLIDEYGIVVVPILLGAGKPLFKDGKPADLRLIESRAFANGLTVLRYAAA